jgi:hypothetical protein
LEINEVPPLGSFYLGQFLVSTKTRQVGWQADKQFYRYGYSNYFLKWIFQDLKAHGTFFHD